MKKIILLIMSFLLTGCFSDSIVGQHKAVSDAIVNIYMGTKVSRNDFNKNEWNLINEFYQDLKNPVIDLNEVADYFGKEVTNFNDTSGTYIENGNCYIRYNDILFVSNEGDGMGPASTINCSGYQYILVEDYVELYDDIVNNPKYNYRYLGYVENNNEYKFIYRSIYDGSGLVISVNDERIETSFENVDNYKLKTVLPKSTSNNIFSIVFIIAGIVAIVYFIKIYNKNHEI